MSIGFISDLHIDLYSNETLFLDTFMKVINDKNLDTVIIAGDITEDVTKTIKHINMLNEKTSTNIYYVPGNHDLWNKHNGLATFDIIEKYINHKYCLLNKEVVINNNVILGSYFWYDYSLGDNKVYKVEEFDNKEFQGRTWQDKRYINFNNTDVNICNNLINEMDKTLEQYKDKNIILVSHMINNKSFKVDPQKLNWNYFNAFLGSQSLYELVKKHKVKYAVCGHVHYRKQFIEGETNFICSCLGYEREWERFNNTNLSLEHQINKALFIYDKVINC